MRRNRFARTLFAFTATATIAGGIVGAGGASPAWAADAKDDQSERYEYQRFTDDERTELARIWETVEPGPVRGMIAHCETAHPGKRRKRPYNRYIRGRALEREPFTWFEN